MQSEPTLAISTPSLAVAAAPHLLGFRPENSLVLIVLRGRRDHRVRVTLRVDLLDGDDRTPENEIAWCEDVAARAVRAGAARRPAYLLVVPEGGSAGSATSAVVRVRSLLEQLGVRVLETLEVEGPGFRMLGCQDARCCPPAGRSVPERELRDIARIFPDAVPARRQDLAAEVEAVSVPEALAARLGSVAPPDPGVRDLAVAHAVNLMVGEGARDDLAERALALASLSDVRVRDTVLWDLLHGDRRSWETAADRLAAWLRECPMQVAAPIATILAVLRWQAGDGARGHIALDRALSADPDYRLAQLLRLALDAGQPPTDWLAGLANLSRSACLGEAA